MTATGAAAGSGTGGTVDGSDESTIVSHAADDSDCDAAAADVAVADNDDVDDDDDDDALVASQSDERAA